MAKRGKHRKAALAHPGEYTYKKEDIQDRAIVQVGIPIAFITSLLVSVPSVMYYEHTIGGISLFLCSFAIGWVLGLIAAIWLEFNFALITAVSLTAGFFASASANRINWHYATSPVIHQEFVVYDKSISSTHYPAYWLFVRHDGAEARLTVSRSTYEKDTIGQFKILSMREGKLSYPIILSVK